MCRRPAVLAAYPACGAARGVERLYLWRAGRAVRVSRRAYFRPGAGATRGQTSKIVAGTFYPDCPVPPARRCCAWAVPSIPIRCCLMRAIHWLAPNSRVWSLTGWCGPCPTETVQPDLAVSVPTLDNGGAAYVGTGDNQRLVVTFHLKHGVRWFDGVEFTSADVLFTYHLVLNPEFSAAGRSGFQEYASVTAPDPYTVVFSYLTWPEAAALIARDPDTYSFFRPYVDAHVPVTDPHYNSNFGPILPEHALAAIPPARSPTAPMRSFRGGPALTM